MVPGIRDVLRRQQSLAVEYANRPTAAWTAYRLTFDLG